MTKVLKLVFFLLIPPVIGLPIALYHFKVRKNNIFILSFLLAIIINYIPPLWDVCHHYISFYNYKDITNSIILFRALTNYDILAVILYQKTGLNFSYFNFLTNFLIFYLILRCIIRIDKIQDFTIDNTIKIFLFITCLVIMPLTAFNRFTLALALMFFIYFTNFKNYIYFILLLIIALIIHKSIFIYILPVIGYILISRFKNKYFLYIYVFCLLVFFRYILFNNDIFSFTQSDDTYSNTEQAISLYSANSQLGFVGWNYISHSGSGILKNILNCCLFTLGIITFFINIKRKRNIVVESNFIISITLLFACWGFVTLTERTLIFANIATSFLLLYYYNSLNSKIKNSIKVLAVLLIFTTLYCELNFSKPLFTDRDTSYKINIRLLFMPTGLLFDFNDFGYTPDFIYKNYNTNIR